MANCKKCPSNKSGKATSKLLAVAFTKTVLCIPEFPKDHTVANTTVNLKDQINVWFTFLGRSPSVIVTNNGATVIKSQCWLSHLNAIKKNVSLPGLQPKRFGGFDYLFIFIKIVVKL